MINGIHSYLSSAFHALQTFTIWTWWSIRLTEQMVVSQGLKNPRGSYQITQGSRQGSSEYPDQDEWLPQVYLLKENIVVQEEAPVKKKIMIVLHICSWTVQTTEPNKCIIKATGTWNCFKTCFNIWVSLITLYLVRILMNIVI